jgi:cytochrome c556
MSKTNLRLIAMFAAAVLGGAVVFADPPPDSPRVKTVKAIADLSEHLDAPDVTERAKKIVAEYDSCDISNFFMVKRRGGFGIGKLAKTENQNAVHFLVPQLAKRKDLTEAELDANQDDYLRVAKGLQAMAQLAPHRGPEFTRGIAKKEKAWADVSVEFQNVTAELRKAIEERDPKKVRLAAASLNNTCNNCHLLRD